MIVPTISKMKRKEDGAAALEFALVLPILIMLVFGIVQFGLHFHRQQGFNAAAREGARLASIPSATSTEIKDRVESALDGVPVSATPTITITPAVTQPCDQRSGQTVVVEVEAPLTLEIPLWGTRDYTITGRSEFRCE